MKTKATILLAIAAIITVSFTATRIHSAMDTAKGSEEKESSKIYYQRAFDEPVGGFVTEDKF